MGDRTDFIVGRFGLASDTTPLETRNAVWLLESGQNLVTSLIVPEPTTVGFVIMTLCFGSLVRIRRQRRHATLFAAATAIVLSGSVADALDLDRGHRVLLERGLQIQALAHPAENGLDLPCWNESNFTSIDLHYGPIQPPQSHL